MKSARVAAARNTKIATELIDSHTYHANYLRIAIFIFLIFKIHSPVKAWMQYDVIQFNCLEH